MVAEMRRDFDELMISTKRPPRRAGATSHRSSLTSSRLERGFWQMAYTLEQWPDLFEG